jgi:hypothetical protein
MRTRRSAFLDFELDARKASTAPFQRPALPAGEGERFPAALSMSDPERIPSTMAEPDLQDPDGIQG